MNSESSLPKEVRDRIDAILDNCFFDMAGGGGTATITEDYIIKLVTKAIVSLATAWMSLSEIISYIRKRTEFRTLRSEMKTDV